MNDSPGSSPKRRTVLYFAAVVVVAGLTAGVMLLLGNIFERKQEAKQHIFRVVELTDGVVDPAEWGKNYPRQYDGYKRTVDIERTKHGGSEAFQRLDAFPVWRELFRGYPFGVDYREERGHAYMLSDQDMTERVKHFKQPGACLHCHASVLPAYREMGRRAGVPDAQAEAQLMKGFDLVNAMPWAEARQLVAHPVACVDCHDPRTLQLRVTRPGFLNAIRDLAKTSQELPHLPSIERWRKGKRSAPYDPNAQANRQEMRTLVCAQCHVEYYFRGDRKYLTYPWHKGLKAEDIEAYYDEVGFKDWSHATSGAPLLKAQHPEFELWSQGIHARSGVSCADCHMPYKREGAIKVSDHHVRSPVLNMARACQTCHRYPESELRARIESIQDRTARLQRRAEDATMALAKAIGEWAKAGAADSALLKARALHRKAQWRLDFVAAENSTGFHAPQEAARLLGEAIDYARQGEVEVARSRGK
jgi:nitrite reductase (cytochrome c-552)